MSGLYPSYYYPPPPPQHEPVPGSSLTHAAHHPPGALAHLISPASDTNVHGPPNGSTHSPSEAGPSSLANQNGKRPLASNDAGDFKKLRADQDFEDEGQDASFGEDGAQKSGKTKSTRGSRSVVLSMDARIHVQSS
jgi:hypothetical protein